jgi:antitoxin ParD1/3/4
MNVLLKPDLEKFIADKLKTGQYTDANQVVNKALEVLKEQDEFTPEHERYLRLELQRGIDQLERGEYAQFNAEKIIAEERRRIAGQKESA